MAILQHGSCGHAGSRAGRFAGEYNVRSRDHAFTIPRAT